MLSLAVVCVVLSVHDGDTLTAVCDGARREVRLMEIDAPELGQPYARASRRALSVLCAGAAAYVRAGQPDRYGRTLARVRCQGRDASLAQVEAGMAWAFTKYVTDAAVPAAEARARAARRGLWKGAAPVAPWVFRAERRAR